jgi:hypothetical protein
LSKRKFEVCIINIHSREIVYLTDNKEDKRYPSWSTDGKFIVYSTDQGVSIMDADGGNNEYLYSPALGYSSVIFWNILQDPISDEMAVNFTREPELSIPLLDMENRECCECRTTVPQTHMERSVIITEYECQDCHPNLLQTHPELPEPLDTPRS